jgi:hypothetical protein
LDCDRRPESEKYGKGSRAINRRQPVSERTKIFLLSIPVRTPLPARQVLKVNLSHDLQDIDFRIDGESVFANSELVAIEKLGPVRTARESFQDIRIISEVHWNNNLGL